MDMNEISLKLQASKAKEVATLVQQAINEGIPAKTTLGGGLLSGMIIIGEKLKKRSELRRILNAP